MSPSTLLIEVMVLPFDTVVVEVALFAQRTLNFGAYICVYRDHRHARMPKDATNDRNTNALNFDFAVLVIAPLS